MRKLVFLLSLVMIFVIPWEGVVRIPGVGSITRIIGVLVAVGWVATILASGLIRKLRPFHLVAFTYLFWNVLSLLWSNNLGMSMARLMTYIQLVLLMWIIWDLYTTPDALCAGIQAYVMGAWLSTYSTVSNYFIGNTFRATAEWTRYSGFGFNANDLALILSIGLPLAWFLASFQNEHALNKLWQVINYAYIPFALFAILLTASRGALLATAPFFFFAVSSFSRFRIVQKIILTLALFGSLYLLQPLIPQSSIDRLATTGEELTEGDLNGRRTVWNEGIQVFLTSPVLGVGTGTFRQNVPLGKVAHNTYLSILVESGFVGFLLFLAMLVVNLGNLRQVPRREAALWITVTLIWGIGIVALSWEHRKPTWLILSFIMVNIGLYEPRHAKRNRLTFPSPKIAIPLKQADVGSVRTELAVQMSKKRK